MYSSFVKTINVEYVKEFTNEEIYKGNFNVIFVLFFTNFIMYP